MIAVPLWHTSCEVLPPKVGAGGTALHVALGIAKALLTLMFVFGWSAAVAADPLRIALPTSPLVLPFYVAEDQGYFAAEGLKLKITDTAGGGVRSMEALLARSADLAVASETVVMFNSFKRTDFAVIATIAMSANDVKIMSRAGSEISNASQLAGKRVGNVAGSAAHYYLDLQLVLHGIPPASVKLINIQPDALESALIKGEVDAIATWEPYASMTQKTIPDAQVLPAAKGYDLRFNLIAHKRLMETRGSDLVKLLRALDRANQFIASKPAKAQAIMKQRLKVEQTFVDWVWPAYKYRLTLEQSLLKSLEGQARWARQNGHVAGERSPNYLQYLHPGPLRNIRPAAVTILE